MKSETKIDRVITSHGLSLVVSIDGHRTLNNQRIDD
jgi:hypothetical protein